jgi:dTDP-4-amino-4,6-dideoxygalactose transaminase
MKVPLLDLKAQYQPLKKQIKDAIDTVLNHGGFVLGPEVVKLEEELAKYCESKHAIGVASGTDALLIALRAIGVGQGDEVITTGFSFFATAGVISRLGAIPVFCDIDERTFNLDPATIEARITPKTKAIMPVHLFGQIAEMDKINEIAKRHNIPVVEDAAQAIGAKYHGRQAGSLGDAGGFSFYPSKNLGAYGDGGFISTNSDDLDDLIRMLRVHGSKPKYIHHYVGYNSRLDTIQAAILLVKLPYLNKWHEGRRAKAAIYDKELKDVAGVITPHYEEYNYHIYNQYTLITDDRDKLRDHLKTKDIGFDIYYPIPLHLQKCYADLKYKQGDLPIAEHLADKVISLPVYPELTEDQQAYVIESIKEFYS